VYGETDRPTTESGRSHQVIDLSMHQLTEAVEKPFYERDEPEPKVRGSYYIDADIENNLLTREQETDRFSSKNQVIEHALQQYFSAGVYSEDR